MGSGKRNKNRKKKNNMSQSMQDRQSIEPELTVDGMLSYRSPTGLLHYPKTCLTLTVVS